MTKAVRIENADTSDHKLVVQVWDKGRDLGNGNIEPDTLDRETPLNHPTAMAEICVHSSRYLVIKEV